MLVDYEQDITSKLRQGMFMICPHTLWNYYGSPVIDLNVCFLCSVVFYFTKRAEIVRYLCHHKKFRALINFSYGVMSQMSYGLDDCSLISSTNASIPAMGSTQPPDQWGTGDDAAGVKLTTHTNLLPRLEILRTAPPYSICDHKQ
jgi:hypothetical protein